MRANRTALVAFAAFAALAPLLLAGCAPRYYGPPPPVYATGPSIVDLASHNGFEAARADGARDAASGFAFRPRRTQAFHDTPGFDPQLGPFRVYRDNFRNAYLRGYANGYRRG